MRNLRIRSTHLGETFADVADTLRPANDGAAQLINLGTSSRNRGAADDRDVARN